MAYQYLFNLKMDVSSLVRVDLVRLLPKPWHKIVNLQILESISKTLPKQFLPDQEDIFRALSIPPAQVKVVIVGQDPYPNPKYAMGMAFSVRENTNPLPASLKNIFTELEDDLGYKRTNGDLSDWKDQGVLLLNRSLTVDAHESNSHIGLNWSQITEPIIESVARGGAIGILWGNQAALAGKYFPKENVLTSAHPSPLSAYRGFFGSKPFSKSNIKLLEKGLSPIKW
jgi:uracil-DNA glycosylase